jgi:hypothetical protein
VGDYRILAMSDDKQLTLLLCETLRERRYRFANASTLIGMPFHSDLSPKMKEALNLTPLSF